MTLDDIQTATGYDTHRLDGRKYGIPYYVTLWINPPHYRVPVVQLSGNDWDVLATYVIIGEVVDKIEGKWDEQYHQKIVDWITVNKDSIIQMFYGDDEVSFKGIE